MERVCLALLAVLLACSAASAQSLAELARREEARRKAIKAPSKVITDADLKRIVPASPPAAPASPQPAAPATAATDVGDAAQAKPAAEEEPAKDEAWWRNRMTEARAKVARSKLLYDAVQTRINSLTNDWAARDDPAQRAVLANERIQALGELQRLKEEIDAQTKAIADIEAEAREAGVPPGWLR